MVEVVFTEQSLSDINDIATYEYRSKFIPFIKNKCQSTR